MSIPILFLSVIIFIVGLWFFGIGFLFFIKGRGYAMMKKKLLVECEKDVQKRYNRIATLDSEKFFEFITDLYAKSIEMEVAMYSSNKDPDSGVTMFARSMMSFTELIGEDNMAAIDYYYGKGFLERWAELNYSILEMRGSINVSSMSAVRSETIKNYILKSVKNTTGA